MRQALAHILPKDVCWHRDKRDPERGQHLKMVRSQALLAVGQSLASGRSLSSRASYIDMQRLGRDLQAEASKGTRNTGSGTRHTLLFLD